MNPHDEPDIDELHRAVLRERQEPFEGREPVPLWMIAGFVALVGWGGWYLGRYDASFDHGRADMAQLAMAAPAADAAAAPAEPDLSALGAQVFTGRCAACHQPTGAGMKGLAPPLAGSDWVAGDEQRLIKVVLHGLQGPIEVNGEAWNGVMPGWGSLSDEEIAGTLTYIRSAWGNDAGAVSPAAVGEIRASTDRSTPWTAQEL